MKINANTESPEGLDESDGAWATIVGPYGQVKTRRVKSNLGGDLPVKWNPEEGAFIPKRYREKGWLFYHELPKVDQTGTSDEDNARYLRMMEKMTEARASGLKPKRDSLNLEAFYHPEVLRRRKIERPDSHIPTDLADIFGEDAAGVVAGAKPQKRGRGSKPNA